MNNINTGMNLLNLINDTQITNQNNQIYFQNIENQNYINIFLNYLDEEKNLISVIKQNSKNKINQYIHQTNIDFLKTRSDICANEYNTKLKKLRENNPLLVKENMALFEEKIILPVYQKIQEEIEQRKDIYRDTYAKYKNIIMKVLEKNNVKDTKIEPYGSIVNNFMTEFGDIDVCISPSDHNLFKDFDKYLQEIREEAVEEQKCAKFIILEQYSKFFILKLKDIETEIDLDITVQYILPIINTKLIRLYSLYDQRFHILGIFLKFWVKKNHIHGALDKFLSSYALLILIIHYLQTIIEPRVLPILQQIHNVKKEYVYHNGEEEKITNLYFEEDFNEIHKYMEIINSQTQNELTVVELLVGFFEYYSYIYNHYFISISRSDKIPADENETIAFPIEDPFDIGYNPGKSMKINTLSYTAFVYCMKKELNNIISGEYFKHYKEE
jgi:DNA polymerase sigma